MIKIIDNHNIEMTQEEYDRLHQAWTQSQMMTTAPCTFEAYVRAHKEAAVKAVMNTGLLFRNWKS